MTFRIAWPPFQKSALVHLEVEVASGRVAGLADLADLVAGVDLVADPDVAILHVRV